MILFMVEHGLKAWRRLISSMPAAHSHGELELNYLLTGSAAYFMAGEFRHLTRNRLAVFWGGVPHQMVRSDRGSEYVCLTIPLRHYLEWQLPQPFTERLFRGDLIEETESQPMDSYLVCRWADDLATGTDEARHVVLLEMAARLHRLACATKGRRKPTTARGEAIDRITRHVGRHYREELTVATIAQAVGLHPNYMMQLFRRHTGMALWDYVIRLRIAEAQRRLLTTDDKVLDIALESGFGSASRFYHAFQQVCRCSPRQYRLRLNQPPR